MRRSQKALDKRGTLQQLLPQISFQRDVETSVYVGRRDAHGQRHRDAAAVPTKQPELTSEVSADAAETSKSTPDFLSRLGRSSPAGAAFASVFLQITSAFLQTPRLPLSPDAPDVLLHRGIWEVVRGKCSEKSSHLQNTHGR